MTASQFADEIGVQRSSVSHILSGRNKPSLEFIQKVINRFPKVDSTWLINGKTNIGTVPDIESEKKPILQNKPQPLTETPKPIKAQNEVAEIRKDDSKKIKKIVVFYSDGTFEEFSGVS